MIWSEGAYEYNAKWSKKDVEKVNVSLERLNCQKPKDIHRAIRGLNNLKFWKGTEFRAMLLYYGLVVLKENLPNDVYLHYVKLTCAVRICYTDAYKSYRPIAKMWFDEYIEEYINIYGIHSIGSNIHNLCHIFFDIEKFGSLLDISTYPFENRLQFLKSRLKQPRLPLQQITRRLVELSLDYDQLYTRMNEQATFPKLRLSYKLDNTLVYKEIQINSKFTISTVRKADSWFLTNKNDIVMMKYALERGNEILIYGVSVCCKEDFFIQPVSSSRLKIFESSGDTTDIRSFEYHTVKAKMICLSSGMKFVFMPLLHTL